MKIERLVIHKVCDQTNVPRSNIEVLVTGPEIAWAIDRQAADLFVKRHPTIKLIVVDDTAEILTREDGAVARLADRAPLDLATEEAFAREIVLARLTPDERKLLKV